MRSTLTEAEARAQKQLGARIKEAREEAGYRRDAFAFLCNMSTQALRDIEEGRHMAGGLALFRMSSALGLPIDDLLPPDYRTAFAPQYVPRDAGNRYSQHQGPNLRRPSANRARKGVKDSFAAAAGF